MNAVTLKKDGTINLNGKTVATETLDLLSCQITLEDVYTLRSFFKMLNKYTLLAKLNAFFPSYIDQYDSCPEQGCDAGLLDYLEFGKTVEMIGGIRMLNKTKNIYINDSLKSRLDEQRKEFLKVCSIEIE